MEKCVTVSMTVGVLKNQGLGGKNNNAFRLFNYWYKNSNQLKLNLYLEIELVNMCETHLYSRSRSLIPRLSFRAVHA